MPIAAQEPPLVNELVLIGAISCSLNFCLSTWIDHAVKNVPWVKRLDDTLNRWARQYFE